MNVKKREFPSGLEPQKALVEVERVAYYAIETYTTARDRRQRQMLEVTRNPLGLKYEVRIQANTSKTDDFLKNPR